MQQHVTQKTFYILRSSFTVTNMKKCFLFISPLRFHIFHHLRRRFLHSSPVKFVSQKYEYNTFLKKIKKSNLEKSLLPFTWDRLMNFWGLNNERQRSKSNARMKNIRLMVSKHLTGGRRFVLYSLEKWQASFTSFLSF